MKKNNKGFAIVEMVVVTVVVMIIFVAVYANYFPLMGEYEERRKYNDINSLYASYNIEKYLLNLYEQNSDPFLMALDENLNQTIFNDESGSTCAFFVSNNGNNAYCNSLISDFAIKKIYLLLISNLSNFKTTITDRYFKKYLDTLPNNISISCANATNSKCEHLLIVKTTTGYAYTGIHF